MGHTHTASINLIPVYSVCILANHHTVQIFRWSKLAFTVVVEVLEGKMQHNWCHSWTLCLGPHSKNGSPVHVGRAGRARKHGSQHRLKGVGWTSIQGDWLGIAMEFLLSIKMMMTIRGAWRLSQLSV